MVAGSRPAVNDRSPTRSHQLSFQSSVTRAMSRRAFFVGLPRSNETRARTALGAHYDLRDFNDTVVKGGNVPMDVLARNIDEYIARSRA